MYVIPKYITNIYYNCVSYNIKELLKIFSKRDILIKLLSGSNLDDNCSIDQLYLFEGSTLISLADEIILKLVDGNNGCDCVTILPGYYFPAGTTKSEGGYLRGPLRINYECDSFKTFYNEMHELLSDHELCDISLESTDYVLPFTNTIDLTVGVRKNVKISVLSPKKEAVREALVNYLTSIYLTEGYILHIDPLKFCVKIYNEDRDTTGINFLYQTDKLIYDVLKQARSRYNYLKGGKMHV